MENNLEIIPIVHASLVMRWSDTVFYVDPTGGEGAYEGQPRPDIVLLTDIHGDHLELPTLSAILGEADLVVPEAVRKELPEDLAARATVLGNGEAIEVRGFQIEATPMYNIPERPDTLHPKGRGNGYVIERDGTRVYIAGDTSATPEMRALRDIDVAFLPMNLPYTMGIEEAAEAVAAFKPRTVYPYHYRSRDGLADVQGFKELVAGTDPDITVELAEWYPAQ